MTGKFMIYGATGYTGKLVSRAAKALGMSPIVAGRNAVRLKAVAHQHGFDYRVIDLADASALDAGLAEVDVVLHIAGPFSQTSAPMLDACLRTRTHYLDITGEIDVFEACASRDAEARDGAIMVMPGVGFDVVPSDCLAAHLKARLPDASEITLAIGGLGAMSRGTAKTGVEGIGKPMRVRRNGGIVDLKTPLRREFDYGRGATRSIAVGWGDVSTAYHSTGVPNITVYFEAAPQLERLANLGGVGRWVLSRGPVQRWMKRRIDHMAEGPSDDERAAGYANLIGEAVNEAGVKIVSRLRSPEGYTLTAMTSLEIVRRVLAGEGKPGFQTPSRVFGAGFITQFDGCVLQDLAA
jgi:short subunit dehydrogenase-like uncharacterized protein